MIQIRPAILKTIWHSNNYPRLVMWTWQASMDKLPTAEKLFKRKILTTANCSFCGKYPENLIHIFYKCPLAIEIISVLNANWLLDFSDQTLFHYWSYILHQRGNEAFWN